MWQRMKSSLSRASRAIGARMPERLWLWWVLTLTIFGRGWSNDVWASCVYGVGKSAKDASISGEAAWRWLQRRAELYPGMGENEYRNAEASLWARLAMQERGAWCSSHRLELMVELAYMARKEKPHV